MCILCVVQKWSRRVATMLPWLVIPLIILWALSQLLPPGLRFEVTSPRLACVLVLLATLFWYEILMPRLSSWRARRTARLRERCRTEALELQKLRKTATRRCRNCQMPYRDQNPGGGRFMCSYCGHISKRPALDLPGQRESTGIIADLVRKNGWLCDADGNGNWVGPVPKYLIGSDYLCSTERSYSGAFFLSSKLLSCFFLSVRWLCGKVFRFGSLREDGSCDSDHRSLSRKGEIDGNFQESRGEKARRKAEEKRQARLEKEMLEEEERKQREEVARLVEERRKLRDEIVAAETECSRSFAFDADRDARKEMDRKKRDRRKDKDKASSKSNSDGEELEKRASRENERKWEFDKKGENERQDLLKSVGDNYKSHALDGVYGSKVAVNKARYFDRMKGTFLSSSRDFGSAAFFSRYKQSPAAITKSAKPATGFMDHNQNPGNRRDAHPLVHVAGKSNSNVGDKASEINLSRPAGTDILPKTGVFNKPWHELFTGSSEASPCLDANSANRMDQTGQLSSRSDQATHQNFLPSHSTNYLASSGHSLPFVTHPSTAISVNSNPNFHIVPETAFPPLKKPPKSLVSEDAELFEDPCYVPDPISLLGPVSESLDNFSLNLEADLTSRSMNEGSPLLKGVPTSANVNKPSPIEPRLSKLNFPEVMHSPSDQLFCTPKSDVSSTLDKQGTWQMWGSSSDLEVPGLIGRPSGWFSTFVQNNSQQQDFLHSSSHKPIVPPISKSKNTLQGISGQSIHTGNHDQHGGTYSPLDPSLNDNGIWIQSSPLQSVLPFDGDNHLLPLNLMDTYAQSEAIYSGPNKSTAMHPFETHKASSWSKDKHVLRGPREAGNLNTGNSNVESFFSRGPDVPSVWSCKQ